MMNKYINILKYRYLHSHQTFIKSISLMKGENRTDTVNDEFLFS